MKRFAEDGVLITVASLDVYAGIAVSSLSAPNGPKGRDNLAQGNALGIN
jgi:hypothetical protein